VDKSGDVHVVWKEDDGEIYYALRRGGGTWAAPQNISNTPASSCCPLLAVDSDGIVHVVWGDEPPGNLDVYYAWRGSDGAWSSPQNISNDPGTSIWTELAVDDGGAIHVIWVEHTLNYARRSADGIWSNPENIPYYNPTPKYPANLAVDGNGNAHVVWSSHNAVLYVQRSSSGTWSDPTELSGDLGGGSNDIDIAVNKRGDVHVVWIRNGIYHAWRRDDGTWSDPHCVSDDLDSWSGLQVAVDEYNTAHVVWGDLPSYPWDRNVLYAQWNQDEGWSNPHLMSDNTVLSDTNLGVRLVASEGRMVHMVWKDGSTGSSDIVYTSSTLAAQSGESVVSQVVTVPVTMSAPTLSFLYQLSGASDVNDTWFNVQADNGITATTLLSTTTNTNAWTHRWLDLTPWAGQAITLTFNVHQTAGSPYAWAYLDEVSIGSAYPDLWVTKDSPIGRPAGEQIVYTISYGNRGGALASGVRITDTLPVELTFVTANPLPITTTPSLVWDGGDLLARSNSFTIVVTVTVATTAPLASTLTNTVTIEAISPELETFNNTSQAATFIGYRTYLPTIIKIYLE
jgi:uncharacterized repeat protein (TIGR01451 family)